MTILNQAFAWLIRSLYSMTGVYSISIILMTIIFNVLMLPLAIKQLKSTENMQKIQPQVQAIQKKYKNDKETMNKKVMELYQANNVNPLAGCLPLLIQMPIIFALFAVMKNPLDYIFVDNLELGQQAISQGFLWIKDLSQPDQFSAILNFAYANKIPGLLPIITAVLTYVQMQISTPKVDSSSNQGAMGSMKIMMPFMILVFSQNLSAGLVLYWATGTIFRILQQMVMNKISKNKEKEV